MTNKIIQDFRDTDILTVDRNKLVDIDTVEIDSTMDTSKRLKDFAAKIKNPYCYICNGIIVKMSYSNNGPSLSELIKDSIQAKIG